jgi:hypothetical protein
MWRSALTDQPGYRRVAASLPSLPLSEPEMMSAKPIFAPRRGLGGEVSSWSACGLTVDLTTGLLRSSPFGAHHSVYSAVGARLHSHAGSERSRGDGNGG